MAEYDASGLPDMGDTMDEQNEAQPYDQHSQSDGDGDGDEDDDYDPSSFNFGDNAQANDPAQEQDTQTPAEPIGKPNTKAGFIIEDDSDEDEQDAAPPPSQMNGAEGAQSGLGAVAVSEATVQDVSLASEPTHDSAAPDSLNGSTAAPSTLPAVSDTALPAVTVPAASLSTLPDEGKQDTVSPAAVAVTGTASVSATPKPGVNGVSAPPDNSVPPSPATQRLPHDKVGRLEDRIKDDPKADTAAWLELIQHYREKDQIDNVRRTYDRMLEVFPTTPSIWLQYLQMENEFFDRNRLSILFHTVLPRLPNTDVWNLYLDYVRRIFPLMQDPDGSNRKTVLASFEAVLAAVGTDPASGKLWREYIDFVKTSPGNIGGTSWQDQQKGDQLRKAYQRAIRVPSDELVRIWKEYDSFEMTQNKATGRKMLQEQSPHYMQARTAGNKLEGILVRLDRRSLPVLPPIEGCEGDDAFAAQVTAYRSWIDWEKEDPLILKDDELALYRARVIYAYKQACIQLRFYPTIWFEAAQWCYEQAALPSPEQIEKEGDEFLDNGVAANLESVLLALKKADRIESGLEGGNSDDVLIANGEKMEEPFEKCLKALYGLRERMVEREKQEQQQIKEYFDSLPSEDENDELPAAEDDDDAKSTTANKPKTREDLKQVQLKVAQDTSRSRIDLVKRMISHVWIAKMRAFRRVQGQGMPKKPKKGFRGIFEQARPRGQITSDVYIASALLEWNCYRDPAANKIFERGMRLFPTDENFALEYIKHMIANNDVVNARVVFETTITKILAIKDTVMDENKRKDKVRPLLGFMHHFESEYGDLAQMQKLEKRMKDMFPDEPEIERFSNRYHSATFDAMAEQIVISPTQARPKMTFMPMRPGMPVPTMEPTTDARLQLGPNGPYVASPKRPLDDADDTDSPSRKFIRAESPLKGAAGRRIQTIGQQQQQQQSAMTSMGGGTLTTVTGSGAGGGGFMIKNYVPAGAAAPARLPPDLERLLAVLPPGRTYNAAPFSSARMVDLLRQVDVEGVRARLGGQVMSAGEFMARGYGR